MIMQLAMGFVFGFVFGIVINVGLAPISRAVVFATISLLYIGAILTKGMEGFVDYWANPFWFGLIVGIVVFNGGARIWRRPPP